MQLAMAQCTIPVLLSIHGHSEANLRGSRNVLAQWGQRGCHYRGCCLCMDSVRNKKWN
jgi:hypothetical protein